MSLLSENSYMKFQLANENNFQQDKLILFLKRA